MSNIFQKPPDQEKYPVGPWLLGLFVFVVCGSGTVNSAFLNVLYGTKVDIKWIFKDVSNVTFLIYFSNLPINPIYLDGQNVMENQKCTKTKWLCHTQGKQQQLCVHPWYSKTNRKLTLLS